MTWPWDHLLDLLSQMLSCHFIKSKDLNSAQRSLNQFFTEDMLITFLISSHPNMFFSFEQEKNGKLPFLDIEVSWEKGKFVTTVYRKPTFSDGYTHFESFLPTVYKFGIVYTLAYSCFKICSYWAKFHEELSFLKQVFKKRVPFALCHSR